MDDHPEALAEMLGTAGVIGIGRSQADGADRRALCSGRLDDGQQRLLTRVAGVDGDQLAATDEVGVDRQPIHSGPGRLGDPDDVGRDRLDLGQAAPAGRDRFERRGVEGVLEALQVGGRREPHRHLASGQPVERRPWREPSVRRDLVTLEGDLDAGWQEGREEAGVEPPWQHGRGDPSRERDQRVGMEADAQPGADVGERRPTRQQRGAGGGQPVGRSDRLGEEHAGLLE